MDLDARRDPELVIARGQGVATGVRTSQPARARQRTPLHGLCWSTDGDVLRRLRLSRRGGLPASEPLGNMRNGLAGAMDAHGRLPERCALTHRGKGRTSRRGAGRGSPRSPDGHSATADKKKNAPPLHATRRSSRNRCWKTLLNYGRLGGGGMPPSSLLSKRIPTASPPATRTPAVM